ncbi:AAA family ATPase, partial [Campylobacter jejuni]
KENLNYLYDKKGNIKGFKSIGVEQKDIKESIEKRKEILKTRNEKLKDIQANRENISKTQQAKIKTLNEKLIDKAKLVKSEPNLIKQGSNYDKRNLENDLIEIKDNINAYILNNEEQNQFIKILEDKEKHNTNFNNTFNKDNFQGIFTYSLKILEKEVIIKENLTSELRQWLEEGLKFHKEHLSTQQCKFCNNPLTLERIVWIENNIKDDSGEKEKIEEELKDLLDNFENYKLELKKILLGIEYENFYSNYKDIFIGLKEQLGVSIANYNEELLKIEKKLTKKKKDVFTPIKLENTNDFSDEIFLILNKIENLCKENDEYTNKLSTNQDEARKKLRLNEVAKFVFKFKDNANEKIVNKEKLEEILSNGEKRALYILQILFEIEAQKNTNKPILLIFDDIVDSFDYRNKHAVVEYLDDIRENINFKIIIMTHNFDFYRAIARFGASKFMIHRNDEREIVFGRGEYTNEFIKSLKKNDENIKKNFITLIPFVRNILEYTKNEKDKEYLLLTSCLHMKDDTKNIKVEQALNVLKNYIQEYQANINKDDNLLDFIYGTCDEIANTNNINPIELQNKIVLSIGIRLKAEEFMLSKVNLQNEITRNQTRNLYNLTKEQNAINDKQDFIIRKVLAITSDNIHINSFMYEPILDTSIEHLVKLYRDIKEI